MKYYFKFFIILLGIFLTCNIKAISPNEMTGVWGGIEVMGGDFRTAQEVRRLIPIKEGMAFSFSEIDVYKNWCNKVKKKINTNEIKCGFVGYPDGKFYLNLEILPVNKEPTKFRSISKTSKSKITIPKNLEILYDQWDKQLSNMLEMGIFPEEVFLNGYLDYKDLVLHSLAKELTKHAYRHNNKLLNVIRYSEDAMQRNKAAALLSWSRNPNNLYFILRWNLLDDPDEFVRNELSRSISFTLPTIQDTFLLKKAINTFCKQAQLPSHSDRNKALVSLQEIIEKNKNLAPFINQECKATLVYISEMSILPNAGGIAKNILSLIEKPVNA